MCPNIWYYGKGCDLTSTFGSFNIHTYLVPFFKPNNILLFMNQFLGFLHTHPSHEHAHQTSPGIISQFLSKPAGYNQLILEIHGFSQLVDEVNTVALVHFPVLIVPHDVSREGIPHGHGPRN